MNKKKNQKHVLTFVFPVSPGTNRAIFEYFHPSLVAQNPRINVTWNVE